MASPCTCATYPRSWTGRRPSQYVLFGTREATEEPAVTIAIAKRKGTNAIRVADRVLAKVDSLKGVVIPSDVTITTTRHYGRTAEEKSNELLFHMAIAVVGVTLLIALVLGWRESAVVGVAIPVTLALTLATFYFLGYTLNRITAVRFDFLHRHPRGRSHRGRGEHCASFPPAEEQGPRCSTSPSKPSTKSGSPLILATLTVIAAILPMAFVSGLMGPYMRPIPDRVKRGDDVLDVRGLCGDTMGRVPECCEAESGAAGGVSITDGENRRLDDAIVSTGDGAADSSSEMADHVSGLPGALLLGRVLVVPAESRSR